MFKEDSRRARREKELNSVLNEGYLPHATKNYMPEEKKGCDSRSV